MALAFSRGAGFGSKRVVPRPSAVSFSSPASTNHERWRIKGRYCQQTRRQPQPFHPRVAWRAQGQELLPSDGGQGCSARHVGRDMVRDGQRTLRGQCWTDGGDRLGNGGLVYRMLQRGWGLRVSEHSPAPLRRQFLGVSWIHLC